MSGIGYKAKAGFRLYTCHNNANVYPLSATEAENSLTVLKKGDLIPLLNEGVVEDFAKNFEGTLQGKAGIPSSQIISKMGGGQIGIEGCYLGLDALIAAAMGWEYPATTDSPTFLESAAGSGSALGGTTTAGSTGTALYDTVNLQFSSAIIGEWVRITSGAAEGQVRRITAVPSTSQITVTPAWTIAPGTGVDYQIAKVFRHDLELATNMGDELVDDIYSSYSSGGSGGATDILHRWGTLVFQKTTSVWEWRACMVNSMSISLNPQDGLRFTFELVPFDLDKTNSQTPDNWAWSAGLYVQERIKFPDCVFRMDDYSASTALTSNDELAISEFSLNLKNNFVIDDRSLKSSYYRLQPVRSAPREITGSIVLPRYAVDTRLSTFAANTIQMADLISTGSLLITGGTYYNAFQLYMKSLVLTKPDYSIGGPGVIKEKWDFQLQVPAAEPKGMGATGSTDLASTTGDLQEMIIRTINTNPFNAFRGMNAETT